MFIINKRIKLKVFCGNAIHIKDEIQEFFKKNEGTIIHEILQSESVDISDLFNITITIFYEEAP